MRLGMHRSLLLAALAVLALDGCSPAGTEVQCQLDSDCASGTCLPDGTCSPGSGGSGGSSGDDAAVETGGTGGEDAAVEETQPPVDAPDDGTPGVCQPNHDGVITRGETPLKAGLSAKYKIAANAQWDTAGLPAAGNTREWDLSGAFSGDHLTIVETIPLDGLWFAPDFAGATYASRLSDSEDLLGVFELTNDQLLLRGIASPAEGLYRTKLTYDPPVVVLQFPVQQGATWETTSTVSGLATGVTSYYTEKYANQVDATGSMKTPYGTFDVLRIRVVLTRTVAMIPTTIRQYLFSTECFGTVASVASNDNETAVEFTQIKELKRLSP